MPEPRRSPAGPNRRAGVRAGRPRYPRTARVNHVLQQVVAEELERLADDDSRLTLVTVTGVEVDPDLRHATVWFGSLTEDAAAALGDGRIALQAAIARQVRMKRTPLLTFAADPAIASGSRIEEILRAIMEDHERP